MATLLDVVLIDTECVYPKDFGTARRSPELQIVEQIATYQDPMTVDPYWMSLTLGALDV